MKLNEKIVVVMVVVLSLFFILITNVVIRTLNPPAELLAEVKKEQNAEKNKFETKILRGTIYDRNGNKLAYSDYTKDKNGNITGQKRLYPYNELFAHTVGYVSEDKYYMLENSFDDKLLAISDEDKEKASRYDNKEYVNGASLGLTLDAGMTEKAKELLGVRPINRGSVVVMNPKTGEIYCMYSNPTFNPNPDSLSKNYTELDKNKDLPLFSRSTNKDIPGSVFKIVTAIAAVEHGKQNFTTSDEISVRIGNSTINNYGNYTVEDNGEIDLEHAIQKSSNVYFAKLSQEIGNEKFLETAEKLFINKDIITDIPVARSTIETDMNSGRLADTAYGQGSAEMTPLQMAMIASTVANNGILMKPYLVDSVTLNNGETVFKAKPEKLSVVTTNSMRPVKVGMVQCVNEGTGTAAAVRGLKVAGKTGTAEYGPGVKDSTWFIGFAPADNPQIAICVMGQKTGGSGGNVCGTVAKGMFEYCLKNGFIKD